MISSFKIDAETVEKCAKFANDSVSSSIDKYSRRGQSDTYKVSQDIRNGKIGEVYAHKYLLEYLPFLSEPDFAIYSSKNKTWDPDLKDANSNISIGVKTQDFQTAMHYGDSWVFQFGNGINDCDKEIFGKLQENKFVVFVSTNFAKRVGAIQALVSVPWLHQNKLFKEMKKESLRSNKLAVYLDDLKQHENDLFQLKIS